MVLQIFVRQSIGTKAEECSKTGSKERMFMLNQNKIHYELILSTDGWRRGGGGLWFRGEPKDTFFH